MISIPLEGFKTLSISDHIESPTLSDLLRITMYNNANAEFAYQNGNELFKYLFDKTPLTNKFKHVYVTSKIHYLTPSTSPIKNIEWHIDSTGTKPWEFNGLTHLLLMGEQEVELTSRTQFLEDNLTLEAKDNVAEMKLKEVRYYFENSFKQLDIKGKTIPQNRFVTFNARHVHRAVLPTKNEFRLIFRVSETDIPQSDGGNNKILQSSSVTIFDNNESIREVSSIEQNEKWIIVRDKIEVL